MGMSENTGANASVATQITSQPYLMVYDFCKAGHDIRDKETSLIREKRYGKQSGQISYKCRECQNTRMRERVRAKGAKPQKHFLEPDSDLGVLVRLIRNDPEVIKQLTEIAKVLTAEQK